MFYSSFYCVFYSVKLGRIISAPTYLIWRALVFLHPKSHPRFRIANCEFRIVISPHPTIQFTPTKGCHAGHPLQTPPSPFGCHLPFQGRKIFLPQQKSHPLSSPERGGVGKADGGVNSPTTRNGNKKGRIISAPTFRIPNSEFRIASYHPKNPPKKSSKLL